MFHLDLFRGKEYNREQNKRILYFIVFRGFVTVISDKRKDFGLRLSFFIKRPKVFVVLFMIA